MNTHKLFNWLVVLTLLLPILLTSTLIPVQAGLGSLPAPNITETINLAGSQVPTVNPHYHSRSTGQDEQCHYHYHCVGKMENHQFGYYK